MVKKHPLKLVVKLGQSRHSHLKSLVFINKVIIAFFTIALILYIDGSQIFNLKVKIILLSSLNLNGQKTPVEISGKMGPCVHKAVVLT